jgi:hypothetical protein
MKLLLTIRGERPLVMHSDRMVNPFDPITREIKRLTSKRTNKTEEDLLKISELEFAAGMYYDAKIGPYIPGPNVLACIRDGGKRTKHGKKVEQAVTLIVPAIPLVYEGPRKLDELWSHAVPGPMGAEEYPYRFITSVKIGKARTMRTRPKFDSWALKAELLLNPSILDADTLEEVIRTAGEQEGLGDHRPHFGRFSLVKLEKVKN